MSTTSSLLKPLSAFRRPVDWEAVYHAELPRVLNFFRYLLTDDSLAEDLTAETFQRAWQRREQYDRDRGATSTWLFTIAHHVAADHFRHRSAEVPLDQVPSLAGGPSPEEALQQQDDLDCLARLLRRLPVRERELVALKYGAGLTNRAIARQTGLSETNVGTILQRVVHKLRIEWEENI